MEVVKWGNQAVFVADLNINRLNGILGNEKWVYQPLNKDCELYQKWRPDTTLSVPKEFL